MCFFQHIFNPIFWCLNIVHFAHSEAWLSRCRADFGFNNSRPSHHRCRFQQSKPEQDIYSLVFNYKPFRQMEFNFQKHVSLQPGDYLLMVKGSATPNATDHIHKWYSYKPSDVLAFSYLQEPNSRY